MKRGCRVGSAGGEARDRHLHSFAVTSERRFLVELLQNLHKYLFYLYECVIMSIDSVWRKSNFFSWDVIFFLLRPTRWFEDEVTMKYGNYIQIYFIFEKEKRKKWSNKFHSKHSKFWDNWELKRKCMNVLCIRWM